jgi:hypothetical protein
MKNDALFKGAELVPISFTFGMSSGRGVVSMRRCWLNLEEVLEAEETQSLVYEPTSVVWPPW